MPLESPILTGLGLAPSAGLNAYVPLLVLALTARLSDRVALDRPYDFLESTSGIVVLLLLLTIEIVADKIPGVDHANDLIQSAIRPASGAISMMAATNADDALNPVVAMIVGLVLAGGVHGVKATARPAITVSTGGLGNPVISMVEDAMAILTSILAVLVPIVAVVLVIFFGLLLWSLYKRVRNLTSFLARAGGRSDLRR